MAATDKSLAKIKGTTVTGTMQGTQPARVSMPIPAFSRPFWADWSLWTLVGSNLWATVLAVHEKWSLADVLWTFWLQSVIIGLFWFCKILMLKTFSTDGVTMNNRPVPPTIKSRNQMAFFFLFHYGFFHFIYAVFLIAEHKVTDKWPIILMAAIFFANHLFSFIHNRKWDNDIKPNLGTVMLFPYARIVPMHLTIIFGTLIAQDLGGQVVVVLFLLLKTIADVIMHAIETTKFGCRTCNAPDQSNSRQFFNN